MLAAEPETVLQAQRPRGQVALTGVGTILTRYPWAPAVRLHEEHVVYPDQSFCFLRYETGRFERPRHRHHELELTWIESGAGLRFVGDSVAPFAAQDLVLVGADVPHAWLSFYQQRAQRGVATVVQFPLRLLTCAALPELRETLPLAERAKLGLRIDGQCREALIRVLRSMREADALSRLSGLIQILALLRRHERQLMPIASSIPAGRAPRAPRRIDQVTHWIYRNLGSDLSVSEAARIAHITPAAFSRFFRREAGKTFCSYVNDVRCGEAFLKLQLSDKPVARIAYECGFGNMSHFNRQFRRRFGLTPIACRDARG